MKRFLSTALVLLLGPLSCFAQGLAPARLVSVDTNGFANLRPQYATAQSALSWIDDNWDPLIVASGWAYLPTNAATSQAVFDWVDEHWFGEDFAELTSNVTANAATMSYNAAANNWNFTNTLLEVFLDLFGNTNDSYRVIQDPAEFRSNYLAAIALNDTNASVPFGQYSNLYGRLDLLFYQHFTNAVVPYVDGGDSTNAALMWNIRDEIYRVLAELGVPSLYPLTYLPNTYTSNFQVYTVPTNLSVGTELRVHLWGGGPSSPDSRSGSGGYTVGSLFIVAPEDFVDTPDSASHVTNGMQFYVQVPNVVQRAAIWRKGDYTNFHSMSNEILVAGGGGGHIGGSGGGANGTGGMSYGPSGEAPFVQAGGGGATQNAGGYGGSAWNSSPCPPGVRIWGGAGGQGQHGTGSAGGDGYYGGGAGWAGGGGSGYFHPSVSNAATYTGSTTGPVGTGSPAHDTIAGTKGNYGKIVVQRIF